MLKGSLLWKIKSHRGQKERLYRLQEDGMTIWFESRFQRAHSKQICKSQLRGSTIQNLQTSPLQQGVGNPKHRVHQTALGFKTQAPTNAAPRTTTSSNLEARTQHKQENTLEQRSTSVHQKSQNPALLVTPHNLEPCLSA